MTLHTGPRQGEHIPLVLPDGGAGAFVVSLSWRQKAPEALGGFFSRLLKKAEDEPEHHDLDLYGYVFDDENRLKAVIGPDENALTDISGAMFHSGDDATGAGGGEAITVQTRHIPDDYRTFFFLVRSKYDLDLDKVAGARVRLLSAEVRALSNPISPPADMRARGYIFCHVARTVEGGWTCRSLDSYTNFEENWGELLASYNVRPVAASSPLPPGEEGVPAVGAGG